MGGYTNSDGWPNVSPAQVIISNHLGAELLNRIAHYLVLVQLRDVMTSGFSGALTEAGNSLASLVREKIDKFGTVQSGGPDDAKPISEEKRPLVVNFYFSKDGPCHKSACDIIVNTDRALLDDPEGASRVLDSAFPNLFHEQMIKRIGTSRTALVGELSIAISAVAEKINAEKAPLGPQRA